MLPGHNLEALQNIRLNGVRRTEVEEERRGRRRNRKTRRDIRRDTKRREHRKVSRGSGWSEERQDESIERKRERESIESENEYRLTRV